MEDNETAGIGHNNPPFDEILKAEQAEYVARIDKMLLETGGIVEIITDEDLEKAVEAAKRADKAAKKVDEDRKLRNVEFDEKIAIVNVFFRNLAKRSADERVRILDLVNAYNKAKEEAEALIRAERAEQLKEEARIREEAAKEMGGVRGQVLQQESQRRTTESEVNARAATDTNRGPTRTAAGTVSTRKTLKARIKEPGKIPLAKLKGFFDNAALTKAAQDWGKFQQKTSPDTLPEMAGVEFYYDTSTTLR